EAVRRLKGEPGSSVTFKVQHPGGAGIEKMTVTRELIQMESILGDRRNDRDEWDFMLDPAKKIGYIRIVSFGRETQGELKKAMDRLKKENVRGLVLDLRFNPGGLLGSAIAVADMFLTEGEIVSTSGRNSPKRTWSAHKPDTYEGFPMVVLVNRASASASEIVSASLQDHKRAIVVGERTWGKGSVQTVMDLEGGKSILKLTTASYQRPNGHNIHRFPDAKESDEWGVMPDAGYELKLDDREFLQLQLYRRDRDILTVNHATGQATTASEAGKSPPPASGSPNGEVAAAGFVDRQLQKAVDYLSSELAKAH
ncbi:MAG TPA: S41 family peptidase, partial [Pirellulales bacterium]